MTRKQENKKEPEKEIIKEGHEQETKIDNRQEHNVIEEYKLQLDSYVNDLKRLQADFENYKKRADKENQDYRNYCNRDVLFELLTLMDDFDHVIKGLHNASKEDLEKAIKMLHLKFKSLLNKNNVRSFNSLNEKFDPYKHEVLMKQDSDNDKDNMILEEFQKGYYYKDKILRHAKVKISKKGDDPNEEQK